MSENKTREKSSLVVVAEPKLAEEERVKAMSGIVNAMGDGLVLIDMSGKITTVNPAFERMTGYEKSELVGKDATELMQKMVKSEYVEKAMEGFKTALQGKVPKGVPLIIITKDGRKLYIASTTSFIKDVNKKPIAMVFVAKDITKLKRAEEELLQSKKLASIGQLTAGVAHEFNTPLTNINLTVANISSMTKDPEIIKKLKVISEQTKIATNIVQSLLRFSRKIEPKFRAVNLNEVISRSLSSSEGKRPENIEIIKYFHVSLPNIKADFSQLQQVFTNIIDNAYDAMPEGGKLIITTAKDDGCVKVRFIDTGTGISKEDIEKVFDPFFSKKKIGKGTGLGLSLSHGIVKAHNGSIDVQSEEGNGSTFIVSLPAG